jgi:hypothetical protein
VKSTLKKKIGAAAAAVSIAGAGSMAFAYWTADGAGTGTASAGSAAAVVIVQDSDVTNLGPGTAAQDLNGHFEVDRPTYVGAVTVDEVTTDDTGCTAADFTVVDPDPTNAEIVDGDDWDGGSIVFKNDPARNQDDCQGATVTISYVSN